MSSDISGTNQRVPDHVQPPDPAEQRQMLANLHPECWGWALRCCRGNTTSAEEVLQMSYQKILSGRARFSGQSAFKTWLFGVIRVTALDERRWNVRRWLRFLPLTETDTTANVAPGSRPPFERDEQHATLRAALARLTGRQAEVLHLVFYHDLTLDEAASVMRVSPGTARTHYERGKAALRKLLETSDLPP